MHEGVESKDSYIIDGIENIRQHYLVENRKLKFDLAKLKVDCNLLSAELMRLKQTFDIELEKSVDNTLINIAKINPFIKHEKKKTTTGYP